APVADRRADAACEPRPRAGQADARTSVRAIRRGRVGVRPHASCGRRAAGRPAGGEPWRRRPASIRPAAERRAADDRGWPRRGRDRWIRIDAMMMNSIGACGTALVVLAALSSRTSAQPRSAAQARDIAVLGFKLHYLEAGSGPAVVLLHG